MNTRPIVAFWAVPIVVLAPLLAFVVASPSTARAAEPGVVPDLTWATSSSDQDRTAAALEDAGARWVRLNANWADAEPVRGQFSTWWFEQYDRAVELARAAGARIVLMSYQSPSWASGSTNKETPPKDPADFARFMGSLASRYKGKVEAYEVWNEENISRFWSTGPDPSAYVRLLTAAYAAIKQADPEARVVFGGLSLNDYQFVERAYDAGAKGHFDVMSAHPYTCANSPESISRGLDGRMTPLSFPAYREVRASMLARGDAKPIWFTELGWSTTTESCGVSEATQADYLARAYRFVEQDPYVEVALWYNLRNNYWNHDADTIEARYGLLRTDFSPKPAYGAFKDYAVPVPPTKISRPTLSGTAQESQTLVADPGVWSGTEPIAYAYRWRRCEVEGQPCAPISGETSSTYTLTSADVGERIRVVVIASNTAGSARARSAPTAVVEAAPSAAVAALSLPPPTVFGTPEESWAAPSMAARREEGADRAPGTADFKIIFPHPLRLCPKVSGHIGSLAPLRYLGAARIYVGKRLLSERVINGRSDENGAPLRVSFPARAHRAVTEAAKRAHRRPVLEVEVGGVLAGRGRASHRLRRFTMNLAASRCRPHASG